MKRHGMHDLVVAGIVVALFVTIVIAVAFAAHADSLGVMDSPNINGRLGGVNYPSGGGAGGGGSGGGGGGGTAVQFVALPEQDAAIDPTNTAAWAGSTGTPWTSMTLGQTQTWANLVYGSAAGWIAASESVGADTPLSLSSDGKTWTAHANVMPTPVATAGWSTSMAASPTRYCATTDDPTLANLISTTSTDGVTWSTPVFVQGPSTQTEILPLSYTNGQFIAPAILLSGTSTTLAFSTDCATWGVPVSMGDLTDVGAIVWNGALYCSVDAGFGATHTYTSTTGVTWTAHAGTPSFETGALQWNGSTFCGIDTSNNTSWTSPDCVTWTAHTITPFVGPGIFPQGLAYDGSVFLTASPGSTIAAVSTNCVTWTSVTLPSAAQWFFLVGHP